MLDRLRQSLLMRRERWEGLCTRCGLCCYEKEIKGASVITNFRRPCLHLDTGSHQCTVYDSRFDVCAQCRRMTLRHALFVRWLPENCGYVQHYRYRKRGGSA